jgi:hypothetical protein
MAGIGLFMGDERAVKATHIPIEFEDYINGLRGRAQGVTAWDSPWFRSVIHKRANAVRAIPRRITKAKSKTAEDTKAATKEKEIEEREFDGQLGKPRIEFRRLLEQGSTALDLYGAMYLADVRTAGRKPLEVRWLDPRTIKLRYDKATGKLLGFERWLNGQIVQFYVYDETTRRAPGIAWAWTAGMNETGPGDTLAAACDLPAKTLVMADELMRGLYSRGAINQHWVTANYNPPEAEKERLRERIRRFMFGGVENQHNIEVFNEGLTVTKVGTDPNALELGPTADRLQNDICSVCDTPRILLNAADASNRATIDRITQTWLLTTIAPHAQQIIDALNFHVLSDLGYELELNTAGLDVDQAEEMEKAQAWAVYVDHDVNAETAAEMLGIDIPEGMEFIDTAKAADRQAATQSRMDALRQAQAGQGMNTQTPPDKRRTDEIKRLGEHIKTGAYLVKPFKSDVLSTADIEAAIIAVEWEAYP